MNKAIFLDRDGTINIDKGYVYKLDDFEFLPGAREALRIFQDLGFLLIIVTNQSGIARGYYTEEDYLKLDKAMREDLSLHGIEMTDSFFCPHLPDGEIKKYSLECDCRKPKLGMYERAIRKYNIDLKNSICIGDKERDVALCKKFQKTIGYVLYQDEEKQIKNIKYIKGGLLEAAEKVRSNARLDQTNSGRKGGFVKSVREWKLLKGTGTSWIKNDRDT